MAKEITKPKTKAADRIALPSSSQKYSQTYLSVCENQETNCHLLYLQSTVAYRELLYAQSMRNITFDLSQAPNVMPFYSKNCWKVSDMDIVHVHFTVPTHELTAA